VRANNAKIVRSKDAQCNTRESPQGSPQGDRLFCIHVNNFLDCVTEGEVHLYTDDTPAYVIGDSVDEVALDEIRTW